jgi:hypothetical protein
VPADARGAVGWNGVTMGHVVHYRSSTGESRLEDVASMEAAVELIERLRNEEGVDDVRLFREVPLKVRTYYKVVVDEVDAAPAGAPRRPDAVGDEPPPGAMNLAPPPAVASAPASVPVEEPDEEPRRASIFNRG